MPIYISRIECQTTLQEEEDPISRLPVEIYFRIETAVRHIKD